MSLISMTGFAEAPGANGSLRWRWEVKSVNGRGFDLRLRMPPGFDGKPLKSLSKGEVDFGLIPLIDDKKDEAKAEEKSETDEATVIAAVKLAPFLNSDLARATAA